MLLIKEKDGTKRLIAAYQYSKEDQEAKGYVILKQVEAPRAIKTVALKYRENLGSLIQYESILLNDAEKEVELRTSLLNWLLDLEKVEEGKCPFCSK